MCAAASVAVSIRPRQRVGGEERQVQGVDALHGWLLVKLQKEADDVQHQNLRNVV